MTQSPDEESAAAADEARIDRRAEQLPEETQAGGADDPHDQAEAILAESDERTEDPAGTREDSVQTPDEPVAEDDLTDGTD